jgi:ribonucleoside-diphosphate reductase beta chain
VKPRGIAWRGLGTAVVPAKEQGGCRMTERKSPTAVLREGPRALTDEQVREIEEADLKGVLGVDIDDVIEYVHKDLKSLPDFTTLYRRYLKQRWDVYDLDFTQDKIDWTERMTEAERHSFLAIASGFHHGERQVEIELPVFMIGASEEEKLHIAAQIEDEARHTVFFDRFYREVVGLQGDDIMDILDANFTALAVH